MQSFRSYLYHRKILIITIRFLSVNVADIKQEPISPPMVYHPPPRGGGGGAREGPALDSRECRSGDIIVTDGQTDGPR